MKRFIPLFFLLTTLAPAAEPPKAGCCAVQETKACCAEESASPAAVTPVSDRSLYQLDATCTTDAGASVQLAELRGQPLIVAMFFAQCEYACPMLVADIRRVRASLPAAVRDQTGVVLVSFDTERDTPTALRSYREKNALDQSWTLLRGEPNAVQDLAMLLGVKYKRDERGQFAHSNLLTVLNKQGEIVQQRAGLQGDVSELAAALAADAR